MLVDGCTFNTGDDCISIKVGKNRVTQHGPTRDIVIQNCVMNSGHGAVTLGSENGRWHRTYLRQESRIEKPQLGQRPAQHGDSIEDQYESRRILASLLCSNVSIPNGVQIVPKFYTARRYCTSPKGIAGTRALYASNDRNMSRNFQCGNGWASRAKRIRLEASLCEAP